ncbi:hypothetical protein CHS0354_030176 [Potamilus streckersoni]|uniref:Uncharacterized protein n=1 Tax=Potamilus streckersoni TaxID=2493646 RepID=A0AAE0STH0_9BIVA|nr:hypothetical protein CHS0354_030176 [Potamilus streckersoni]
MPRRRRKSIQAKKEPLVFTESPVNIVHRLPSPVLSARHPPTAQSVSVEDCLDVSWVSPQFTMVPLDDHGLQRRTRGRKQAHRNDDVNRTSHEYSNNVKFILGKCSKFKSLKFVGDSAQTEKECINMTSVSVDIGRSISDPCNRRNTKRSQRITLKQKNRSPFHKTINEEGHKDYGENVDQDSSSNATSGSVDEDTENSIEGCSVKPKIRKCKHNFTKIKKKVSPKNKSDISTSEPEDGTRNIERVFKKFKTGRKRMYTTGLMMEDDSGSSFRGHNHVLNLSVNCTSPQRNYDKNDPAPVKDLFPEYSTTDKIENTLAIVRQLEDTHTFRTTLNLKKQTLEESFSNNSSDCEIHKDASETDIPVTCKFNGLKMLFLNCSPSERNNTDQYKILVKDTPESEYGIPCRKRQLRKQR